MDFPVVSRQSALITAVTKICKAVDVSFIPRPLDIHQDVMNFLETYLPEFLLLDLSCQQVNLEKIIERYESDPWLYYGCIALVHTKEQTKVAQQYTKKYSSILCAIPIWRFVALFSSVLEILKNNPQLTLSWDLQKRSVGVISNSFEISNDPDNVFSYANIITRLLERLSLVDYDTSNMYNVVISELLMNAMEHGNCHISHEEKKKWLEDHQDTHELVRQRAIDPEIKDRRIYLSYEIHRNFNKVIIRDEGKGFDWRSVLEKQQTGSMPEKHGFGIAVVRNYVKEFTYNEKGNQATIVLEHKAELENKKIPGLFRNGREVVLEPGDQLISEEGAESPELYFIISGKLIVSKGRTVLAQLDSADMFCGEMNFLLGYTRSANVHAKTHVRIIAIGYQEFMESIRKEPYYALLLARLVADRLYRTNTRVSIALEQVQLFQSLHTESHTQNTSNADAN